MLTNPSISFISLTGKADVEFLNLRIYFSSHFGDRTLPNMVYEDLGLARNYVQIRGIKFVNNHPGIVHNVFSLNIIHRCVLIENCEVDENTNEAFKNNSGRMVNCVSKATTSFGGSHSETTEFINCEGGAYSFNGTPTKGLFRNCKADTNSFGYTSGISDAKFYLCEASDFSFCFYENPMSSSEFINCRGKESAFTSSSMSDCYFENCYTENGFYGDIISNCIFKYCGTEANFSSSTATVTNTKYILCSSEMSQGYFSLGTNMVSVGQYIP